MNRILRRTWPLLGLLMLTMVGAVLSPLTILPDSNGSDVDESFSAFMVPRLSALLSSAQAVEGMVSERSRNVLALRAESQRIDAIVEDIDTWLAERDVAPAEAPVVSHYRDGATHIRTAIDAAYDAISSFDYSAMPQMIPVFSEGTNEVEAALELLRTEADASSSYTVGSVF